VSTRSTLFLSISLSAAALLTGCGIGTVDHSSSGTFAVQGVVFGGQQPVNHAKIQLYTVGSSGNASGATPMIADGTVQSDVHGNFDITGAYKCGESNAVPATAIPAGSNQVYIVATDGNPGLTADNPAMVLIAALGDCSVLATTQFIEINEVTTAAAAWALAPFMTSETNVGATLDNSDVAAGTSGIANAFLDAGLLADTSTGLATVFPTGSNLKVETDKLYALANSIASCVNSEGGAGCSPLFLAATPTGGTPPSDTLTAALNIVKNPGENVLAVYAAKSGFTPFPSAYTKAPNDWTMSLTVTGGAIKTPTVLAIDSQSNVWVVSQNGPLTEFSAQGTLLSGLGYGVGVLDKSQGIAIDTNDDVWVTDYNAHFANYGAIIKFLGEKSGSAAGTVVQNTEDASQSYPGFFSYIYYPTAVSADTNGKVFVTNAGYGATVLNSVGSVYSQDLGGAISAYPNAIAVDANHGYWIPDDNYSVIHVSAAGVVTPTTCCHTSFGVATDSYNNVWVANEGNDTISAVQDDGAPLLTQVTGGGLENPIFVAVDAAQNVWFSNFFSSISEFAGKAGPLAPGGTPISPTLGAYGTGGYGLDARLGEPKSIVPDRAGNIWVTNQDYNNLTMFFGLATPTVTPIRPVPIAP
jgi:hypothetical protein